ncbi:type I iodothyronine deiodinase-like isoform X2 [Homarus americanus]|uniref:type I iodothyronine deiodinase-like isoform X2 n=1 Tax=Homarus americanus TaxID=6706 RepID=UPI001C46AAB8|nr:type I iodothyronine deiodinase-like isoform X2 [Homarus americanus]XP_042210457.1 type I iodothyronine deiodinase-like isoform X2 [Homarus americanus]XP_042210458.1 type I iodothyronine deiodinase-like isoform X2 [Homarus americanus]XP_042210459.1 type I iodothyronine deiodinase-like isoform X2 [Homarus americanus]
MANLERFRKVTEDFSGVAEFVLVYVAEAHPTDGWAIKGNVEISSHKTMEERLAAAQRMLDLEPLECPVLVDLLTDETSKTYGSVPERLYIVQDGVIVYKGGQGPNNYKLAEVEEWLEKYKGQ